MACELSFLEDGCYVRHNKFEEYGPDGVTFTLQAGAGKGSSRFWLTSTQG